MINRNNKVALLKANKIIDFPWIIEKAQQRGLNPPVSAPLLLCSFYKAEFLTLHMGSNHIHPSQPSQ